MAVARCRKKADETPIPDDSDPVFLRVLREDFVQSSGTGTSRDNVAWSGGLLKIPETFGCITKLHFSPLGFIFNITAAKEVVKIRSGGQHALPMQPRGAAPSAKPGAIASLGTLATETGTEWVAACCPPNATN